MIRVAALTSGPNTPSTRFRVRQFIRPLRERGVSVAEHHLGFSKYLGGARNLAGRIPGILSSWAADVTWLERELIPGRLTLEPLTKRPRLFDVDDALWLIGKSGFSERIAALSDGVIAGNEFLAEHYRASGVPVWVVPTSIDTDTWVSAERQDDGDWTVGWIGTAATLPYLLQIERALARFVLRHDRARLLVVSDERPKLSALPEGRWHFEQWSAEREVQLVQGMSVGLMPLPDSRWAQGKCSCKMLSYMSVGLPVVVTPVGTNKEILSLGEVGLPATSDADWTEALEVLFEDATLAALMGRKGRAIVESRFSVKRNVEVLARILREVAR
jgi:glycosyltransferase involved in cell wall biosynthesis